MKKVLFKFFATYSSYQAAWRNAAHILATITHGVKAATTRDRCGLDLISNENPRRNALSVYRPNGSSSRLNLYPKDNRLNRRPIYPFRNRNLLFAYPFYNKYFLRGKCTKINLKKFKNFVKIKKGCIFAL